VDYSIEVKVALAYDCVYLRSLILTLMNHWAILSWIEKWCTQLHHNVISLDSVSCCKDRPPISLDRTHTVWQT